MKRGADTQQGPSRLACTVPQPIGTADGLTARLQPPNLSFSSSTNPPGSLWYLPCYLCTLSLPLPLTDSFTPPPPTSCPLSLTSPIPLQLITLSTYNQSLPPPHPPRTSPFPPPPTQCPTQHPTLHNPPSHPLPAGSYKFHNPCLLASSFNSSAWSTPITYFLATFYSQSPPTPFVHTYPN